MKKALIVLLVILGHTGRSQPVPSPATNPNVIYVSPTQFGAVFNGTTDDIAALDSTVKYCMSLTGYQMVVIQMPQGICRITRPWVIGYRWVDESDCFGPDPNTAPSYNATNYAKCRQTPSISIEGYGATALYLDFDSANSSVLRAGIYYALQAGSTTLGFDYAGHISGLGIYAKGSLFRWSSGGWAVNTNQTAFDPANKAVGILCVQNVHFKVEDCRFYGLREGIILNNSYFMTFRNCNLTYCNRGYYTIRSHASVIENVTVSDAAQRAFEIRSNVVTANTIYTLRCPISLYIATGNSVFNACYLESANAPTTTDTLAQVVIGDNPWDPGYVSGFNGIADGVVFNGLTIATTKADHSPALSIWMKKAARRTMINGGLMASSDQLFQDPANNELIIQGVYGTFPLTATLPQVYRQDPTATFKTITFPTLQLPPSPPPPAARHLCVDPNGKVILCP